jgi:hypothetical protein
MRKKNYILTVFILLIITVSCENPIVEKPEILIKKDKMIEIIVDAHLAEATFNMRRNQDSLVMKSSSTDFYYSVLKDHQVTDSVFEQSFVYYASFPKQFEKMYQDVMNKLNEIEQEYSGRKNDLLELGTEKKQ